MEISPECYKLQRELEEIRTENACSKKFVPDKALDEVVTSPLIRAIVEKFQPQFNVQEMVDFICKGARKVFCILVLSSHVEYIKKFVQCDQLQARHTDDLLPFEKSRLQQILGNDYVESLFFDRQWEFSVPVFSGRIIPRVLESQTVLPYLLESPLADGGYGSVYKVQIHTSHQPSTYKPTAMFVRKELRLGDLTYEKEVQTMSTLQRLNHPHILRLVGCYTFNSKHNLISPFIADGTLRDYLAKPKPAGFCKEEFFYSISGLASAIWALHEFVLGDTAPSLKGHHQDLRPDNILVDGHQFILADFGLSSIKPIHEDSRTPFKGCKGYCQAPECADLEHPYAEYKTTRKTDIFALACIMADLLVYLVKGVEGVETFVGDRRFKKSRFDYSLYHKGDSANQKVEAELLDLVSKDQSQSLRDTVRLVIHMLELSPEKRPEAASVTARIYMNTIKAFSERFEVLFDNFKTSPDARIEMLRFNSWIMSQDVGLYSTSSDPTTTGKIFAATIDILRQMKQELTCIDQGAKEVDSRPFNEVRALNTQLLNSLTPERRASARSRLMSMYLAESRPEGQGETLTPIRAALGNSYLNQRAETQHLVAQVESATVTSPSLSFELLSGPVTPVRAVGRCHVAKLRNKVDRQSMDVIAETIKYPDPLRRDRLLPRIQALCKLLSSKQLGQELRTPKFHGLYDNEKAFSFDIIYQFPEAHETDRPLVPISLRDLLTEKERNRYPSRETRLKLGLDLAESLAAFHDVTWFHKDLASSNVLFFPTSQTPPQKRGRNPYLVGFQHSRSADDDFTEGPLQDRSHQRYHHPSYVSPENRRFNRFRLQYDWYSLGILLIEIGLWDTIDTFMQEHAQQDNYAFSKALIDYEISALSFHMGDGYEQIVRECLTGLGQSLGNEDEVQQSGLATNLLLKNRVVLPLKSLDIPFVSQSVDRGKKRGAGDQLTSRPAQRARAV